MFVITVFLSHQLFSCHMLEPAPPPPLPHLRDYYCMIHTMRNCIFGNMRRAKAQISLRIRAVWSGHSLSANRIIRYYRMYEWRESKGLDYLLRRMIWICVFCASSKAPFSFNATRTVSQASAFISLYFFLPSRNDCNTIDGPLGINCLPWLVLYWDYAVWTNKTMRLCENIYQAEIQLNLHIPCSDRSSLVTLWLAQGVKSSSCG